MKRKKKFTVQIVTGSSEVADWLDSLFNTDPNLQAQFYIHNVSSTRDTAMNFALMNMSDLVIYFEGTPKGVKEIETSEMIYTLALRSNRIIYITKRQIGDPLLDVLVGYGVYDIITDRTLDKVQFAKLIFSPRKFRDAAAFKKQEDIADNETQSKLFKTPNFELIMNSSDHVYKDHVFDKYMKGDFEDFEKDDDESLLSKIYSEQEATEKHKKQTKPKPITKQEQSEVEVVEDLDIDLSNL